MKQFTFERIQSGYWGQTRLGTTTKVKASSESEAIAMISRRKNSIIRLRNGDTRSWSLVDDN